MTNGKHYSWHHLRSSIFPTDRITTLLPVLLTLCLACTLSACSLFDGANAAGNQGTPTAAPATPTPEPAIALGVQSCPTSVNDPAHWDPIIPTTIGTNKVEKVICGNLIGKPTLQALVTVRGNGDTALLDALVYDNIASASPTEIFKLQNLEHGDATISGYNTVLTSEVDPNSSANAGKSGDKLIVDLFREFKWSDGAGTLVPVAFPGLFPDLTRFQAEQDQAQVNQGKQAWKLDAVQVGKTFVNQLLQWSDQSTATVVSGGGQNDAEAVIDVVNAGQPSIVRLTMQRLEGNTNGGIWVITQAATQGMSIVQPVSFDRMSSPVTVNGTGPAFEGVVGTVSVLDHLYTDIGHAQAKGAVGNGNTTFSTQVTYVSSFKGGSQEGIVALYVKSNANGSIAGVVMVKEMVG